MAQRTEHSDKERAAGGEGISWRRLPFAALLAAVAAAVANALVYLAASGLGFVPRDVLVATAGGESPMTLGMVAGASVAGAIGAAVVLAVIAALSRRPVRLFRRVAVAALVLSFITPLTIPGAPVAMILSLVTMHVVAWAVIVGLLTTLARRR